MKKLFVLAILLQQLTSFEACAQLNSGALAFLQYSTGLHTQPHNLSFAVREPIPSGTVVYLTNRTWNSTDFSAPASNQGTLIWTFNEQVSVGQVISVTYSSGATPNPMSDVGLVSSSGAFDFGSGTGISNFYVYQMGVGGTSFITAAAYNTAPTGNALPNGVSYAANGNAIELLFGNGASAKCGCWTQYTTITHHNASGRRTTLVYGSTLSNLTATFYNKDYWIHSANSTFDHNTGVNACTGEADGIKSTSLADFLSNSLEFDRYRWGYQHQNRWDFRQAGSATWVLNSPPANLTSVTRMADVTFYKDYVVGTASLTAPSTNGAAFDPAAPQFGTVEFAKLRLVDRGAQNGHNVTLFLNPGITMMVHNRVSMEDSNAGSAGYPKVHLFSGTSTGGASAGRVYYAQIAPSNAYLSGTYKYSLVINEDGWHHLYSPIKTTLASIQFDPAPTKTPFAFDYTTEPTLLAQGRNVYKWNPNDTSHWKPAAAVDSLSREPYTLFIDPSGNHVPLTMVIEGSLRYPNQALTRQLTAGYTAPAGTSTTGGYYSTWLAGSKSGWNFYGNPYLTYIDVASLKANYASVMTDMSNAVYTWDPSKDNLLNGANYYTNNGTTGDVQAQMIAPFQGFFMQNTATAQTTTGFVVSKKYRLYGNFFSVKRKSAPTELALCLRKSSGFGSQKIYLSVNPAQALAGPNLKNDAAMSGGGNVVFGVAMNNNLYTIKSVPTILDSSVHAVAVLSPSLQDFTLSIGSDFDPAFEAFLYDAKLGTLVNLNYSAYTFTNDTTFKQFRFTWFVVNKKLELNQLLPRPSTYWFVQNDALRIGGSMALDAATTLVLYAWDGRKMASAEGRGNEVSIPTAGLAKGPYVMVVNGKTALKVVVP